MLNHTVNDFLDMKNEDILEQNHNKKFDIILANPPWGQSIHYEFTQKFLDLANQVISIMPNSIVKRDSKHFKKFKDAYNDKLYDIEEVDSKLFEGTNMQNCCIFCFKDHIDGLHIKYLDGKEENLKCINEKDYSEFTPYEKEIVKYLYNEKPNLVNGDFRINGKSVKGNIEGINKYVNKVLSKLPDDKVYLICNATDGTPSGKWTHKFFSSRVGQIFDNKDELKDFLIKKQGTSLHYMYGNSKKSVENMKLAMERQLLRFPLMRTQSDQHLTPSKDYKYIPNIDWSNDKVKTDEGILEFCGCPKDKCKEYADYCREQIESFDEERKRK